MNYIYDGVHSEMHQHIRNAANFYSGITAILDGDGGNNDEGFHFPAGCFGNMRRTEDGLLDVSSLEFYAVGTVAGLYDDLDDADEIHRRRGALVSLLTRAAKLDADQIDALLSDKPKGEAA